MSKSRVWICPLAQIWPSASGGIELLIGVFSNLHFNDEVWKCFLWDLGVSVWLFHLGFAFYAMLCCRRQREVWRLGCSNMPNLCLFCQWICISLVKKYVSIEVEYSLGLWLWLSWFTSWGITGLKCTATSRELKQHAKETNQTKPYYVDTVALLWFLLIKNKPLVCHW